MHFIDLKTQYKRYQTEIDSAMNAVLEHGQFIMGPEVYELEKSLSKFVGVKHCITVSSGTHSLEIALRALNVGPGDEVITTPFTWISSAEVIKLVGAQPVFVDIDPETYLIDVNKIERAITSNTKVIMPVSLFGQMPELEAINDLAERHGLSVIEDAAQSFGAKRFDQRSGSLTKISSTSFFPAKPFGCYGDGGALFTDDDHLAEHMRAIRTHGGIRRHHHTLVGTNGRFDTLQAAVLLAKFPYFEKELEDRTKIGSRYTELIDDFCVTPKIIHGNTHIYAQYTIQISNRDQITKLLKEKGIPSGIYYPKCLHEQPVFADLGYKIGDFPEAERAASEVMSLPMHPFLTEKEIEKIAKELIFLIKN